MNRLQKLSAAAALGAAVAAGIAGCEARLDVPQDATLMSEGSGLTAARAPHSGTVYVVDSSDNKVIYKGRVEKNQLVTVDTDNNRVTIDGETVTDKTVSGGHRHKILFKRDEGRS